MATRKRAVESDLQISIAERSGVVVCDPDNLQRVEDRRRRQARIYEPPALFRNRTGWVNPEQIDERAMLDLRVVHQGTYVHIVPERSADNLDHRLSAPGILNSNDSCLSHES